MPSHLKSRYSSKFLHLVILFQTVLLLFDALCIGGSRLLEGLAVLNAAELGLEAQLDSSCCAGCLTRGGTACSVGCSGCHRSIRLLMSWGCG